MDSQHPLPWLPASSIWRFGGGGGGIENPDTRLRLVDINFVDQPGGNTDIKLLLSLINQRGETAITFIDRPKGENVTNKSVTTSKHHKGIPACINDSKNMWIRVTHVYYKDISNYIWYGVSPPPSLHVRQKGGTGIEPRNKEGG